MTITADVVPLAEARRKDLDGWRAIAAKAPPFLTPEFFAMVRAFAPPGAAVVARARRDGRTIGALPLLADGHTLRSLRGDQSPLYDYVGEPEGLDAIWSALVRARGWSELVLTAPATSKLVARFAELARADGCPVVTRPHGRHMSFALPDFEEKVSAKFLSNLARCARKAGGIELERLTRPSRADVDEALAIEAMAWKAAAGTSLAADRHGEHLFRALLRLYGPRERAALSFVRAGGARIATLFSVEDDRTLYALKIGYDPRHAAVSPGHLMIREAAKDALRRGLVELDLVGREDDWKKRWTDRGHEQVVLIVYKRNPRGLARWLVREELRPRLPETLRYGLRSPLPRHCQRADLLGTHTVGQRVHGRLVAGLGIRSGLRRAFGPTARRLGLPSRFEPGTWVRIKDEAQIRATLDARGKLRGLAFVPAQWATCGEVHRVAARVRRIRDDHGVMRPISCTVRLDHVDCGGHSREPAGCGRHCPLFYRDEWLEPVPAPRAAPPPADLRRRARIRDAAEIAAGLDPFGRRDGLTFMPEMARHAGKRYAIARRVEHVFEHDRWVQTRRPLYVLDGLSCTGAVLGERGPCERGCALLWHEDWLVLEPDHAGTEAP
jgi:CelD/BcsL family acetyltransferase involved in cellulose biosynthesis